MSLYLLFTFQTINMAASNKQCDNKGVVVPLETLAGANVIIRRTVCVFGNHKTTKVSSSVTEMNDHWDEDDGSEKKEKDLISAIATLGVRKVNFPSPTIEFSCVFRCFTRVLKYYQARIELMNVVVFPTVLMMVMITYMDKVTKILLNNFNLLHNHAANNNNNNKNNIDFVADERKLFTRWHACVARVTCVVSRARRSWEEAATSCVTPCSPLCPLLCRVVS